MKLQPLYDLQQDINRLFIAGSKFAKGDPRLQKHISIFNKLGEKAPVFKKLATDIEELVNLDQKLSGEKLIAISTLLYSVLYTQGEQVESDTIQGKLTPNINLEDVNTEFSYLILKPVIEALSISRSGRLEILIDALERGIFKDSRTYMYLDKALGDKYSELGDFVEKKIIPTVGKPILPFLLQGFDFEDRTENVRRLRLLYAFDAPDIDILINTIFEKSLPNLQAECINIMADKSENEDLIIKLADDKNKVVREAAYMALAKLNTQASLEKLKDAYLKNKNKTNLPFIVNALASTTLPFFFDDIIGQVSQAFDDFVTLGKDAEDKELLEKLDRLNTILPILSEKNNDEVFAIFEKIVTDQKYSKLVQSKKSTFQYQIHNFSYVIRNTLNTLDNLKVTAFWERTIDKVEYPDLDVKKVYWGNYLDRAMDTGYSKEKLFDTFSQIVKDDTISFSCLFKSFTSKLDWHYEDEKYLEPEKIDKRWLDLLYEKLLAKKKWESDIEYALQVLNVCEPPKTERFEKLILSLLNKVMPAQAVILFKLLVERDVPNAFELVYATTEKFQKNTSYYAFNRLKDKGFWTKFPKEYASKFRKLGEKQNNSIYSDIADEIDKKYE